MTLTLKQINSELQSKQLQLNSLLEITEAINQNFTTDQLFNIYEFVLRNQLKIGKLALFIFDREWKCVILYGANPKNKYIDVVRDLTYLNDIKIIEETPSTWLAEFEAIIPVFHKDQPLAYALIGDLNKNQEFYEDIIPFIQTITNIIVVAIENKKLAREHIKQAGIKRELELAAQMQTMLFPVSLPKNETMEVNATYIPHQEVGGDYYDFIRLINFEIIFCMADVSGKGIPAALLMSNFQANLHALANNFTSLSQLVRQLNSRVIKSAKGEKFITLFIGKFNSQKRELNYINAGHNPPLLYADNTITLLEEGTTGLGMFDELPFIRQGKIKVPPDSTLLCYTDGVIDVENSKGIPFGLENLKDFLLRNIPLPSMENFHQMLLKQLILYKQNKPFVDDITLLSCRFKAD